MTKGGLKREYIHSSSYRLRGIECRGREFTPDEVNNLYLHMSRGKWNWAKQLATDAFITLAGECESIR